MWYQGKVGYLYLQFISFFSTVMPLVCLIFWLYILISLLNIVHLSPLQSVIAFFFLVKMFPAWITISVICWMESLVFLETCLLELSYFLLQSSWVGSLLYFCHSEILLHCISGLDLLSLRYHIFVFYGILLFAGVYSKLTSVYRVLKM